VKRLQAESGTAVIWISHDLGVVARLADRVAVMYAGHIVEQAVVDDLYARPAHPYTRGLLNSLPRLDSKVKTKLEAIKGSPPNLVGTLQGCPFAPRCNYATDQCRLHNPPLTVVAMNHAVACWHSLLNRSVSQ
jgi:oligopeptide transport system ATP-binding protein